LPGGAQIRPESGEHVAGDAGITRIKAEFNGGASCSVLSQFAHQSREKRHLWLAVGAADCVDSIPPRGLEPPPAIGEVCPPREVTTGVQHRVERAEAGVAKSEKRDEVKHCCGLRPYVPEEPGGDPGR
jgi:hypothetical protein